MKKSKTFISVFLMNRINSSMKDSSEISCAFIEKLFMRITDGMLPLTDSSEIDDLFLEWFETLSSRKLSNLVETVLEEDI